MDPLAPDTDPGSIPQEASDLVLVVDPNVSRRRELAAALEAKGIVVVLASDGQVALEILEASPHHALPHLIAAETVMPRMDGAGLLSTLKGIPAYSGIPVVLYAGLGSDPPGSRGPLRPGANQPPRTGIAFPSVVGVIESRLRIQRSLRRLSEARASFARNP